MGLLKKAKKEHEAELSQQEKDRHEREIASQKRIADKKKFLHEWVLRLKGLIDEGSIRVEEVSKGFPFACLLKGEKVIGYFHELEESGSNYVSDYGCDVGWSIHELVFSPCSHYIPNNTEAFFSVSFEKSAEETLEEIGERMVSFYKAKGYA